MVRLLLIRLVSAGLLLLAISVAGFALLRLLPGDFAEILLMSQMDGTLPGPQAVARFAAENGLDAPLPLQYLRWLGHLLSGDFGVSLVTGEPVLADLKLRVAASLQLALAALGLALAISLPVGALCAAFPGSLLDRALAAFAVVGMSIPNFWYALLLALFFALTLGWLPSTGYGSPAHIVLPAIAIATSISGILARYVRGCLLEELSQPYVRTARSKGLSPARVLLTHAAPNVFPAVLTLTGMQLARIFDGMIIVETLFGWPGIGRMMVEALLARDYPVIQACFLVVACGYVIVNLAVDYIIAVYDPRVREVV
jgi:peptide/nickel transport system permease protein